MADMNNLPLVHCAEALEAEITDCKPRANNSLFWDEIGFPIGDVDAGNPLRYYDFSLGRALSSAG